MVFRPYGTKYSLTVLGKVRVKLQCMDSEKKLGIITIRHEGKLGTEDTVRQL